MKKNYARELLDSMSQQERVSYAQRYGRDGFEQLWKDAHEGNGLAPDPPKLPDMLTREAFDELPPMDRSEYVRSGGLIYDQPEEETA